MSLPVNIEDLIKGAIVETERIEYKEGWNPESVMHSMCAFANDINNLGGGYIIIGIAQDETGQPVLPPNGVSKAKLDTIQKELLELSNKIIPHYFAVPDHVKFQGKDILILRCPGGDNRPYDAPVSLSVKTKGRRKWIRRYNSTVHANRQEEQQLYELAAKIPFDDRINHQATLDDLSLSLIKDFLRQVNSPLSEQADSIHFPELCRQMQIAKGPEENLLPVNVGLLLFSEHPEKFFPGARIEVIIYQDEVGDRFSEKAFHGPIHTQLIQALQYIQTNVIAEEVRKIPDQAEAERFFNYPFDAVEEILANAVYHRSYEDRNSIEVNIRLNKIEVLSFPGPLPPLNKTNLNQKRIVARDYRNRRIGDFLKELHLTEGRGTGFPKIYKAMKDNGSPQPHFDTDEDRTYFLAILPIHQRAKISDRTRDQAGVQAGVQADLNPTEIEILHACVEGEKSSGELVENLGYDTRTRNFRDALKNLLEKGLLEYTIPEIPKSPKQKYRLSDSGKGLIEKVLNHDLPDDPIT